MKRAAYLIVLNLFLVMPISIDADDMQAMADRIEKQMGKPDRHVYKLTGKGNQELMGWLKEPVDQHVGRHEILLKLFFGPMIPIIDNIKQLKHFQNMHENELTDLKSIKTLMEKDHKDKSYLPYWLMTIRFGELVNEAFIKWSRESSALLEKMNG